MRMSPASRWGERPAMVSSTTAAGTISQMARGFASFFTTSASEVAPIAFSLMSSFTACGDLLNTTQLWPLRMSRRTMLAPILPRPIIPICIVISFAENSCSLLAGTRHTVQFLPLVSVNFQLGGHHIFFEMFDPGSSRDRQHDGRSSKQPPQSQLGGGSFPSRCHTTDRALRAGNTTGRQREPRNKAHFLFFAILQNIFRSAVGDAVTILNAYNRNYRSRLLNLSHAHFRQPDVFDFSLRLQVFQRAELIFSRNLRIDAMQLIKINPIQPQPPQATLAGGLQVFWLSIFNPYVGTRPVKAALGGNHQPLCIWIQRLGYDFFAHSGTIGVRGVDQIDSQFDSAPQNPDGLSPICRLAPNSISRNSHRAESQARDPEIASDQEFARLFGECLVSLHWELVVLHGFSFSVRSDENFTFLSFGVIPRNRRCKKNARPAAFPPRIKFG